jgi:hypothetical protein
MAATAEFGGYSFCQECPLLPGNSKMLACSIAVVE